MNRQSLAALACLLLSPMALARRDFSKFVMEGSDATAEFDGKWGKGFIPAAKFREMVAMNILKNR